MFNKVRKIQFCVNGRNKVQVSDNYSQNIPNRDTRYLHTCSESETHHKKKPKL